MEDEYLDFILDEALDNEEEDFLIVNKSPGLVMHPGAGCHNGTLANALAFHFPELKLLPRCGIVHRLDKDTSGLIVVAKNNISHEHLSNQFNNHTIKRIYKGEKIADLNVKSTKKFKPINLLKFN